MKIELSPRAIEYDGGAVVGSSRVLSGGESAEPLAGPFSGLTDLGDPFSPASLPHPAIPKFVVVGTTFAFAFPSAAVTVAAAVRCFARNGGCGGGDGGFGIRIWSWWV